MLPLFFVALVVYSCGWVREREREREVTQGTTKRCVRLEDNTVRCVWLYCPVFNLFVLVSASASVSLSLFLSTYLNRSCPFSVSLFFCYIYISCVYGVSFDSVSRTRTLTHSRLFSPPRTASTTRSAGARCFPKLFVSLYSLSPSPSVFLRHKEYTYTLTYAETRSAVHTVVLVNKESTHTHTYTYTHIYTFHRRGLRLRRSQKPNAKQPRVRVDLCITFFSLIFLFFFF